MELHSTLVFTADLSSQMPYLHWGVKPDREQEKSSSQFILNQNSSEEEKIKQSFGFKVRGSSTLNS